MTDSISPVYAQDVSLANAVDRPVDPTSTLEQARRRHEANRRAWNEGTASYTESVDATIEFLRARHSNLYPLERQVLGDLDGTETAIHLQSASGRDTLSLWVGAVCEVEGSTSPRS